MMFLHPIISGACGNPSTAKPNSLVAPNWAKRTESKKVGFGYLKR